jgi:hypothetical protein
LCFMVGASGLYAADIDILKKAEQAVQLPSFGPPRGRLTPATAEALARELREDRFVADYFLQHACFSPMVHKN